MLVKYKCVLCGNTIKKLFSGVGDVPSHLQCECRGIMEKELPDFSTTSLEVVDNGAMIKRVELRKDAVAKAKEKGDRYTKIMDERERILKKDEN